MSHKARDRAGGTGRRSSLAPSPLDVYVAGARVSAAATPVFETTNRSRDLALNPDGLTF